MNRKKITITIIALSLISVACFSWWYFTQSSLLDRLNFMGADIDLDADYFRWTVSIDGGKTVRTSDNISWKNMTRDGYVRDGELHYNTQFWIPVLKQATLA